MSTQSYPNLPWHLSTPGWEKAFRREVHESICIEQSRLGFEPEITAKLAMQRVAIREVGVRYACCSKLEGKKISVGDLFNAGYCIVRYRL